MKMNVCKVCQVMFSCSIFYILFAVTISGSQVTRGPLRCDYFMPGKCHTDEPDERCRDGTTCYPAENRTAYCMAMWTNVSGVYQPTRKGCWVEDDRCRGRTGCYEDIENPDVYFCCCEGDMCNAQVSYRPTRVQTEEDIARDSEVRCEYYDPFECQNEHPERCDWKVMTCEKPKDGKLAHCYALSRNESGEQVVQKKGCWLHSELCISSSCVADSRKELSHCCCTGSMCNVDIQYKALADTEIPPTYGSAVGVEQLHNNQLVMTLIYSLVPISIIAVVVMVTFWLWRKHRTPAHEPIPTRDPTPIPPESPSLPLKPIQLLEIKARGRFGCVWKAKMCTDVIAVKIFPLQDHQSFATEKDIYQLPYFTSHENILKYLGTEKRGDGLTMELWLMTEFHERGSLYDHLKGNLVSWTEALKIAESITKGLAFLHDVIPTASHKGTSFKPSVVHRDFKSRNVLVKNNMTACIADFGLAMKFDPCRHIGDTHGQVGTRRYMAPEVLEGSINFSCDHFMRIDMYACGLVLWEIVSRCTAIEGPVEEYQLPFEDEVGQHPTLEDMQEVVVQQKKRPSIRDHWLSNEGMANLCQSIQECWDADPEARLSAGCVQERISQLAQATNTTSPAVCLQHVVTSNGPTLPQKPLDLSYPTGLDV